MDHSIELGLPVCGQNMRRTLNRVINYSGWR